MRARAVALVAVIGGTSAVLTACGPGQSGAIGLSVDDDGRTIVVLQDCKGDIDELKLRSPDDTIVAEWLNPRSPKGIVQFPLVEGAGRWKSRHPVPPLEETQTYSLDGRKKNDASKAIGIDFTPAMLKTLKPGEILKTNVHTTVSTTEVVTLEDFTPEDCG
jgi:hypothetical protein